MQINWNSTNIQQSILLFEGVDIINPFVMIPGQGYFCSCKLQKKNLSRFVSFNDLAYNGIKQNRLSTEVHKNHM